MKNGASLGIAMILMIAHFDELTRVSRTMHNNLLIGTAGPAVCGRALTERNDAMKRCEIRVPIPNGWFRRLFRLRPRVTHYDISDRLDAYDEDKRVATFYRLQLPLYVDNGVTQHNGLTAIKSNVTRKQVRKVAAPKPTLHRAGEIVGGG